MKKGRVVTYVTVFLFSWFVLFSQTAPPGNEDPLVKARQLYQQEEYQEAIGLLSEFILQSSPDNTQKQRTAEALYLLAKIYFEVREEAKAESTLKRLFQIAPDFVQAETNPGLQKKVESARAAAKARGMKREGERRAIEREEAVTARTGKKGVPKVVWFALAGAAVAVLLIFVVFKSAYDIVGDWDLTYRLTGESYAYHTIITFSGGKKSGTLTTSNWDSGTYQVSGKSVEWTYTDDSRFSGKFTGKNMMEGTMVDYWGDPGTWTATRTTSPALTGTRANEAPANPSRSK